MRAHLHGENAFTFGRLHALEETRAQELERGYRRVLGGLPSGDVRRWLKG